MENENLKFNFCPFYVGQKVVYVGDGGALPKGSVWTVIGLFRHNCGHWAIDIGVKCEYHQWKSCGICNTTTPCEWQNVHVGRASSFAPIEERFISLAEVIEIESQLTGAN